MKRSRAIFVNLVFLTISSLSLQAVGVVFQVFLVGKIGATGIGLFQLVSSVYMFCCTLASSGVRFATTRLTAEETGAGNFYGARRAMAHCFGYAAFFSSIACVGLYLGAPLVASRWIGDERTILALRILAVSLPFFAGSSVLGGFFTAIQRMVPASVIQVTGQLLRIGVTVGALSLPATDRLEYACAAIVAGTLVGEVFSFCALGLLYISHMVGNPVGREPTNRLLSRLLHISLPIAVSAYARTALSTIQQMLTPRGLRKSGASGEASLATYGVIHGMVFPILMLPSASVGVLSQLVIPELTESQVAGHTRRIDYIVNRVFRLGLYFAVGVAGIMLFYAGELGTLVYKSTEAGYYLRVFAPLAVIMYLDTLVDGMLKGLGEQMAAMRFNILDSLAGVLLVYFLLPRYAIAGYVFAVFFTEILNFTLSISKLISVTNLRPGLWRQLRAVLTILAAQAATRLLMPPGELTPLSLAVRILLTVGLYLLGLYLTDCLDREDVRWFRSLLHRED